MSRFFVLMIFGKKLTRLSGAEKMKKPWTEIMWGNSVRFSRREHRLISEIGRS
jgi:hypothetical protein